MSFQLHTELPQEILIVDDDPTVIIALSKVLKEAGRIRFAADAKQAFSLIDEVRPDLILLDVDLPDISGLDICIQLKANDDTKDIPVLFITSNTEAGFEEKVFDVGAADYISKPLNPRVVAARTETHLTYHRAMQLLNQQASTDGLTSLANRRAFDQQLETALKLAQREQEPLTVAMIDIDQFKKFNDHFGHLAGDECIKSIARAIAGQVQRPIDVAARYGGEEFALILPNTPPSGAQELLEKLRKAIEQLKLSHAPNTTHPCVTVSIGYSTYEPSSMALNNDLFAIVNAADGALYASKNQGRNQVSYAELS